jgi:ribosomal subunit interface protein
MQVPLQIAFEHIARSDAVEQRVRKEAKKLEQFYERITAARVVIARPQRRRNKGDPFSVRIHLTVPGGADIHVSRDAALTGRHQDAYAAIRDAFEAARRQLQELARKRQEPAKGS